VPVFNCAGDVITLIPSLYSSKNPRLEKRYLKPSTLLHPHQKNRTIRNMRKTLDLTPFRMCFGDRCGSICTTVYITSTNTSYHQNLWPNKQSLKCKQNEAVSFYWSRTGRFCCSFAAAVPLVPKVLLRRRFRGETGPSELARSTQSAAKLKFN
jgi:hypothetical protein